MDVITHVDDLYAFREECINLVDQTDEDGKKLVPQLRIDEDSQDIVYGVTKIPVLYKQESEDLTESLTLIRIDSDDQLQHFDHMHRLGECVAGNYVFDDDAAQATYERVRGDLTFTYTDDEGNEQTGSKPYMIGVFAS